jgi:hypothetical protein
VGWWGSLVGDLSSVLTGSPSSAFEKQPQSSTAHNAKDALLQQSQPRPALDREKPYTKEDAKRKQNGSAKEDGAVESSQDNNSSTTAQELESLREPQVTSATQGSDTFGPHRISRHPTLKGTPFNKVKDSTELKLDVKPPVRRKSKVLQLQSQARHTVLDKEDRNKLDNRQENGLHSQPAERVSLLQDEDIRQQLEQLMQQVRQLQEVLDPSSISQNAAQTSPRILQKAEVSPSTSQDTRKPSSRTSQRMIRPSSSSQDAPTPSSRTPQRSDSLSSTLQQAPRTNSWLSQTSECPSSFSQDGPKKSSSQPREIESTTPPPRDESTIRPRKSPNPDSQTSTSRKQSRIMPHAAKARNDVRVLAPANNIGIQDGPSRERVGTMIQSSQPKRKILEPTPRYFEIEKFYRSHRQRYGGLLKDCILLLEKIESPQSAPLLTKLKEAHITITGKSALTGMKVTNVVSAMKKPLSLDEKERIIEVKKLQTAYLKDYCNVLGDIVLDLEAMTSPQITPLLTIAEEAHALALGSLSSRPWKRSRSTKPRGLSGEEVEVDVQVKQSGAKPIPRHDVIRARDIFWSAHARVLSQIILGLGEMKSRRIIPLVSIAKQAHLSASGVLRLLGTTSSSPSGGVSLGRGLHARAQQPAKQHGSTKVDMDKKQHRIHNPEFQSLESEKKNISDINIPEIVTASQSKSVTGYNQMAEKTYDTQQLSRNIHTHSRAMSSPRHPDTTVHLTKASLPRKDEEIASPSKSLGEADVKATTERSLLEELFPEASSYIQPYVSERNPYPKLDPPSGKGPLVVRQHVDVKKSLRERVIESFQKSGERITALQFLNCSIEFTESDFRRLVPKGKHIESWATKGEFYKIIPGRDPLSLERLPFYYLLFKSTESALAYQANVARLHKLCSLRQASNIMSVMPVPKGLLEDGEDISAAMSSYLLKPSSLRLNLNMVMQPYNLALRTLLENGGYRPIVPSLAPNGKPLYKVLLQINGWEPTAEDLYKILYRHARQRGITWPFHTESSLSIRKLRDVIDLKTRMLPISSASPRAKNSVTPDTIAEQDPTAGFLLPEPGQIEGNINQMVMARVYNRWIVEFDEEDGARRFSRLWNRRVLPRPRFVTWRDTEEDRMVNAEFLW